MAQDHIDIDGIPVQILRKPIKNMHLRIYPPDGRVLVSAPLRLSMQHIRHQLEAKRGWLHKQRARLQAIPSVLEPRYVTGESHYFLGIAHTLNVIDGTGPVEIDLNNHLICLSTQKDSTLLEKQAILKQWHHKEMQSVVPPLINKWHSLMGVDVGSWGAKTMKTRWGSCNTRTRHIWLNLVLIKKPIICLEYVLVHEMVHLLEASHNARFYQLMDRFMPDWQLHKKTLCTSPY